MVPLFSAASQLSVVTRVFPERRAYGNYVKKKAPNGLRRFWKVKPPFRAKSPKESSALGNEAEYAETKSFINPLKNITIPKQSYSIKFVM